MERRKILRILETANELIAIAYDELNYQIF